ncbi:MAG: hypothetical protein HC892_14520 [Saprospiraceae bacterium]|nr:hypothetical protein [Saprospiraceae bacterium]
MTEKEKEKEKAIELIDKFRNYVDSEFDEKQQFKHRKEQETNLSKKMRFNYCKRNNQFYGIRRR